MAEKKPFLTVALKKNDFFKIVSANYKSLHSKFPISFGISLGCFF